MTYAAMCCDGAPHHWIVSPPERANGGQLPARCRRCGAINAFPTRDGAGNPRPFGRHAIPAPLGRRLPRVLADRPDGPSE